MGASIDLEHRREIIGTSEGPVIKTPYSNVGPFRLIPTNALGKHGYDVIGTAFYEKVQTYVGPGVTPVEVTLPNGVTLIFRYQDNSLGEKLASAANQIVERLVSEPTQEESPPEFPLW